MRWQKSVIDRIREWFEKPKGRPINYFPATRRKFLWLPMRLPTMLEGYHTYSHKNYLTLGPKETRWLEFAEIKYTHALTYGKRLIHTPYCWNLENVRRAQQETPATDIRTSKSSTKNNSKKKKRCDGCGGSGTMAGVLCPWCGGSCVIIDTATDEKEF